MDNKHSNKLDKQKTMLLDFFISNMFEIDKNEQVIPKK